MKNAKAVRVSPEFLTVADVAAYLSCGVSTVWTYIRRWRNTAGRDGLGPAYRISARQVRIKRQDVERFMARFCEARTLNLETK